MKLQDAFAAERNAAGGWKLIGYTEPASNNFSYSGTGVTEDATVELEKLSSNMGWRAENKVALNDCKANFFAFHPIISLDPRATVLFVKV